MKGGKMHLDNLKKEVRGPIAYPVTPFKESEGKLMIDINSFRRQIKYIMAGGISVITPCGGTGEFFSLQFTEWELLIQVAIEETEGKEVIIMPSVGGGINRARAMAEKAEQLGCKIIQITMLDPMFGVTEEGIYEYNSQIATSVSIGVMPYRTEKVPMSVKLGKKLCEIENAIAFKEEAGDVGWFSDLMFETSGNIAGVCGGGESLAPFYFLVGAQAFTSGIANLFPHLSLQLYEAMLDSDWEKVFSIQRKLYPLVQLRSKPGRMITVIKEGLKIKSLIKESSARPPVFSLKASEKEKLKSIIVKLGSA